MPLKLEALEQKKDYIEFGKYKLAVPGNIPFEIMVEFYDLKNLDVKQVEAKDLKELTLLLKRILYIENDKKIVDTFVSERYPEQLNQVLEFVSKYAIIGTKNSEQGIKKKDS